MRLSSYFYGVVLFDEARFDLLTKTKDRHYVERIHSRQRSNPVGIPTTWMGRGLPLIAFISPNLVAAKCIRDTKLSHYWKPPPVDGMVKISSLHPLNTCRFFHFADEANRQAGVTRRE